MTRFFQKKREINTIHCSIKYTTVKQHHNPFRLEFTNNRTRPSLKILWTVLPYPCAKNLPKKRHVIIYVLDGNGIIKLMSLTDIKKTLEKLTVDIDAIADPHVAAGQRTLFGLVEVLVEANAAQGKTIQQLKDEVNRLKGEQGKPEIRKQKTGADAVDPKHSSEADRKRRGDQKPRAKKNKKKNTVKIDRRVDCDVDKDSLPPDVKFQGYETRVVQDININTDNVEFRVAVYYSKSLKKTFLGKLPDGYKGEFGPGIRSLVITLYRDSGMTEPAITRFFKTFGIQIAKSTISRMITEGHDLFHQEKEDIINAGLKANIYQHVDDTGCRVNGKNHYTHILCNPYFTGFFTRPKKDRLTLLAIFCRSELKFTFNESAYALMSEFGLSALRLAELKKAVNSEILMNEQLDELLDRLFPNPKKHLTNRRVIRESAAIVYYQSSEYAIKHLLCDDAPQFNKIAKYKSLCWVHEGRHYKKLTPFVRHHQVILDNFIEKFWDYYGALLKYKQSPSNKIAKKLSREFDDLFSTKTGYAVLDERIVRTLSKKKSLLLPLAFPFLPLHNNPAELGARAQARMRDINLQTVSENGTKTKDTFATIVLTARKHSVNIYNYVYDRITKKFEMPSLANLIADKFSLENCPA